ncbi:MAG: helix-turn-helix transcriptional regulator [Bacilli bacterium]|nr:helix-turn-helix transcriptional regulator [Bacilli bacterium]
MSYSEQIKRIRADLLVTQTELAEMLGVTFATINRWERGHHEPSIRQKRAIRDLCKRHGIDWKGDKNE